MGLRAWKEFINDWPIKLSKASVNGAQVDSLARELLVKRYYLHCHACSAFVSKANTLGGGGHHEPFPECVTKLAGHGVHHSHGEHAPELPRPLLPL